jgi:hypothetical protein
MQAGDTPFKATDESSLIAVRAFSEALEAQHQSVEVTAWALLAELDGQTAALDSEYRMLASADVTCERIVEYPCISHVIEKTGYTANIIVQILRDIRILKLRISPEDIGKRSVLATRTLTFDAFDIVEMYSMKSTNGRYEAPQWAVRLGQWATWMMTAQARQVLGKIAQAALFLEDLETFKIAVKLGQYAYFVLHAEGRPKETRIPLLNILAEVTNMSVLDLRDRQHEEKLAGILKKFEAASHALAKYGVCNLRLLRAGSAGMAERVAHNDNYALLSDSVVTISAAR